MEGIVEKHDLTFNFRIDNVGVRSFGNTINIDVGIQHPRQLLVGELVDQQSDLYATTFLNGEIVEDTYMQQLEANDKARK